MNYSEIFEGKIPNPGSFEPCFAFSIHKAGSTLLHNMVGAVCRQAKIPAISVPDILFNEGVLDSQWSADPDLSEMFRYGMLYYGFRYLPQVLLDPNLKIGKRKFVLLVRDPRDALVSQYYSLGGKKGSHVVPKKNTEAFIAQLKGNDDIDIDTYVIQASRNHLKKLTDYKLTLDFNNGLLRKYEDIFYDKVTFLGEIFNHFGFDVKQDILNRVAEKFDIRPQQEDPTKHVRKATPGDHVDKLKPETIVKLNQIFFDMASWYGYDLKT